MYLTLAMQFGQERKRGLVSSPLPRGLCWLRCSDRLDLAFHRQIESHRNALMTGIFAVIRKWRLRYDIVNIFLCLQPVSQPELGHTPVMDPTIVHGPSFESMDICIITAVIW
jgi:hypothetical protein